MGGPDRDLVGEVGGFKKRAEDIRTKIKGSKNITDKTRQELLGSLRESDAEKRLQLGTSKAGSREIAEGRLDELDTEFGNIEARFKEAENPDADSVFARRQKVEKFLQTVRTAPGRRQLIGSR